MSSTLVKAPIKRRSLFKRMLPLYIGYFLQWSVFWYAIEKIFMLQIGFDTQSISFSVALYSATALMMEIPSGILADRWSRKGTLIIASLCLVASSMLGGISSNVNMYLVSVVFWGIFIAMTSGTIEAIVYDVLLEEEGNAENYEKEFNRVDIACSISLVLGGIGGGLIGQYIGLRETFLLSVPAAILSIVFLLAFNEPKIHKIDQDRSLIKHIKLTIQSIFRKKQLLQLLISITAISIVWSIMSEIHQLWIAALLTPVILYGPVQALSSVGYGLGSYLARFIKSKKRILESMILALICLIIIIFVHVIWVNIIAQFIALLICYGVSVVLTHQLHDNLPSKVRAGASSALGALKRILIIPIVILFGVIAKGSDVFIAGWLLVIILVIAIISRFLMKPVLRIEAQNE